MKPDWFYLHTGRRMAVIDHVNRKVQPSSTLMEKWGEGERETVTGRNRDRETEIVTHMQTWESEEGRRRRRETMKQRGRGSCGGEKQR